MNITMEDIIKLLCGPVNQQLFVTRVAAWIALSLEEGCTSKILALHISKEEAYHHHHGKD